MTVTTRENIEVARDEVEVRRAETEVASAKSSEELAEAGKAKRDSVPRAAHAAWKADRSRIDPLQILQAADEARLQELVPIRYGRMLKSPFTFYRGTAAVMAADLQDTPNTGIMVQACGDCHLMNFGGFATPERNIVFDINDFDETLPAPWEWDVKRLATSFVLAVRDNGFSDNTAADVAVECVRTYRKSMREFSKMDCLALWYTRMDSQAVLDEVEDPKRRARLELRIAKASRRPSAADYPKLANMAHGRIHIRDAPPLIFHPEISLGAQFREVAEEILSLYHETLPHERRVLFDRYRFVDAAIKVVGVGSVGTRCWIVLLMSAANDPLFLQLKQAGPSVLEPYAGPSVYTNHGQRVVVGQRLMQAASDIFLGWTSTGTYDFYLRQLRDVKISPLVETFDVPTFAAFARLCGRNLARAHAKTGDAPAIAGYLGKSAEFEDAIGKFSVAYADQTKHDHAALNAAVRAGKIKVNMNQ